MSFRNNYCGGCNTFLGPDDFDGICSDCDEEIEELDDGAPPENSVTCAKCKGYGLVPDYSFGQMQYEAAVCPKCGGEGWVVPENYDEDQVWTPLEYVPGGLHQ